MKTKKEIEEYIKYYSKRFEKAQERIKEDPEDWNAYLERRGTAAALCALKWVLEYDGY